MIPSKRLLRSSRLFHVLKFFQNVNKQLTFWQKCVFHVLGNCAFVSQLLWTFNTSYESLRTDGSFEVLSSLGQHVFGPLEVFLGPGLDLC